MELYKPGFIYGIEHIGADGKVLSAEEAHNIIPTVGLNHILGVLFKGDSQFTTWYLGLYDNNYTPLAADTLSTFIGAAGENSAYTGTARQAITFPSVAGGVLSTSDDPNVFDFTSGQTIRGAFIASSPTWDATAGMLISAVLFPSPKTIASGESLRVPVGFSLTSV